ncbi:MAG TPA: alkaline phosphatase D family protein [Opitutaceae bacterium]
MFFPPHAFAPLALAFTALLALPPAAALAKGALVSGPMLGHRAHREVVIWAETRGAETVTLDYQIASRPETAQSKTLAHPPASPAGTQPLKFVLPLLEMGARYTYTLTIDGETQRFAYPLAFQTTPQWEWRAPPPDFKFIYGSCAYQNEEAYDRPGEPYGKGTKIFTYMADSGADFMVWGGDNLYLREADFSSESGIWYRYSRDRACADMQKLFAVMHHYATWDDHDYGSNDANKSFEFKDVSLAAFKAYWGNPSWGEPDNAGVYTKFFWGDAAFILLDNRYHRDDSLLDQTLYPHKSQYGARQLDWLKQSLLQAKQLGHSTFKFIVTGGQVLTSFGGMSETFDYYRREREELLSFIKQHAITGVIFLSGDVHFTELARQQLTPTQAVYELTSSPFSSGVWHAEKSERLHDPLRVAGTLVADQNYCTLAIAGPKNDRVLTIACFDKTNTKRWEKQIKASELN